MSLIITGSIGIRVYPHDGRDADTLIDAGNTAMYHAKKMGRNTYEFFKPAMNARAMERRRIEDGLRRALQQEQFVLHYQPKIHLETGAIAGVEALIRWMHPQLGLMHPTQFVPVAEESGLIIPIGRWVLEEACRQSRMWLDRGLQPMTVSINISAVEFRHPGLVEHVRAILRSHQLEPRCLELEVTESALMQHAEFTLAVLQGLKAVGVPIAVDDFGTGYSSLSYLRQFPIDVLKIDQSFVRQLNVDPTATPLVTAVIAMGKSLRLRVVAEGVETREQVAFLRGERCDEGQGDYFSPPVVAAQLVELLRGRAQSFTT
jgi:EAL domain-containing protein (putative c-di-GMP-specific phosphodiesterase class I)